MSEKRTKPSLGKVWQVLLYRKGNYSQAMMHLPFDAKLQQGCFKFNGRDVLFAPEDKNANKFIVYESITQVQKTSKGTDKVRLRP